jgi:nitric oxide dioxygenase
MTRNNLELVRKSWTNISKIDFEIVGGTFYIRLFQINPELRRMFKNGSMKEQSIKLGCMLSYVISRFDNTEDILPEIRSLAERHASYGVREEHFKAVGEAFLWTLEQGLGEYWNSALSIAWKEFYETLAEQMIAIQRERNHTQQNKLT